MTKPSYEELRITNYSGSPQIADSASGGKRANAPKETRRATHPMQPVVMDGKVVRFKANAIVRYLIDAATNSGLADMNKLAVMRFSREDREQFAQLIGYSVWGFGELPYVRNEKWQEAAAAWDALVEAKKRGRELRKKARGK